MLNDVISYVSAYPLEEEEIAFLVDDEGTVIAHSGIDLFGLSDGPLSLNLTSQPLVQDLTAGMSKGSREYDEGDTPFFGTYALLEFNDWGVVVESPMSAILSGTRETTGRIIIVNILLFGGALVGSLASTWQISRAQRRTEEELRRRTHDLGERVKEFACLYGVSDLANKVDISLEGLARRTLDLIPEAWQYPAVTCARIVLDDQEFRTANFEQTKWRLAHDIKAPGKTVGCVEVCYLEERPTLDEGPFVEEEMNLIAGIAGQLGSAFERMEAVKEAKDAAEIRAAAKEAETGRKRLETYLESMTDGVAVANLEGKIISANEALAATLGYGRDELIGGTGVPGLGSDADGSMTRSLLAELSRRGSIRNAELEFMTKDGKEVPVLLSATAVKDAEGNTTSYIAVIRDITDRKELENSLRRSEAQALAAIDAAHAFTFSYEIAAGKITWGGGVEEITGYTAEEFGEVDMRQWTKRIHPEDRDGVLAVFEGAPMEERATAEFRFKARKGYITLAFTSTTEMVDGKPVRVVGILQDMTEQKEMQDRLVRSERLAILGQMAGGVGHELRNPLGAIKSAVYLLKMIFEEPEPDVKESLEILEKEVDTSERIISSLLDLLDPGLPQSAR
jgi:PAS domain S-box-containing protein